ncbi:MAG TPA: FAD-dependent oxidoreductase [Myxococcota bacterium]|nr:FAD-dependent oxidoreductase [Myxococcota bacterium]
MSPRSTSRVLPEQDVPRWDERRDVVVVGLGIAGGAAAIEAARAGADTLVLERMTRGGGATALSTGITYFGGGTPIQKACGFEDSVEDMKAFVTLAAGAQADPERIRLYCEGSLEHFEWFRSLGIEFKETFIAEKTTHPFTDDCLTFSGNEEAWPHAAATRPVPRGHKPAREGEAGGFLMEAVLRGVSDAGATVVNECRASRLVVDESGRVVGIAARREGRPFFVRARRGVVLATGGFIFDREMVARHAPHLLECRYRVGTEGDDGSGIRMGLAAGAEAIHMSEGLVLNAYYPPASHLKGILVDGAGRRFVNEDSYLGRTSDAILRKADGVAYLIVDDDLYGRTQAAHRLAAVEETVEALEKALSMPPGALVQTVETYNRWAERGEDPVFHKAARYLKPLTAAPLGALDCRASHSIFGAFTLGGLAARATGEVLDADASRIEGLYAAGRCTSGLCREGRSYASGLSIGDGSFFGRLAGRSAAAHEPARDTDAPSPSASAGARSPGRL